MSDPAAPWWADVQHLRPEAKEATPVTSARTNRFARTAVATPMTSGAVALASYEDTWETPDPAPVRELHLVVEEPVRERITTDDWLALTAPDEHRDPRNGRRTIEIRGQVDRVRGVAAADPVPTDRAAARSGDRRRARQTPVERMYGRPDRIALWAFFLGIVLIAVALIGTPEAGAATPTKLGERPLKVGMQGRDVRHLQLRLKRAGMLDAPATARFGALTRKAVRRYQRSRCLTADGVAGAATVRALRQGRRPCRRGSAASGSRAPASRKTYRRVDLGTRTLAKGMRGRDVRTLQRLLSLGVDGAFGAQTRRAVRRFQRSAGLTADGAVGPATRSSLVDRRMRSRKATWYGPGLYGRRTACGQKLTRRLQGVAHKKLACGTPVLLHRGGRFVTARVVDRGPYAHGATFDLTVATARRIGLRATEQIRARY